MNLVPCLTLAGRGLLTLPNPAKDYYILGGYGTDHDAGRWWDAMLRLEEAIGFTIPAEVEAAMLRNQHHLMDNPDGLLMCRPDTPWVKEKLKRINPHNFREGLLGLHALIRYRQDTWAQDKARQLAATMDRCLGADGRFAYDRLQCHATMPMTDDNHHLELLRHGFCDTTPTTGRSLEALVWLHETTGEDAYLKLATRLAEHHLENSTTADGAVHPDILDPANLGHTHSYLGTMRGLLLYGLLTGQQAYVDRLDATFRVGIKRDIIMASGWVAHDLGERNRDPRNGQYTGEMGSTSDATQLALWLAACAGQHDLWDDVERWVRARFIPSQLTEEEALAADPDCTTVIRRMGGWGCYAEAHSVKDSTPDVFAAATHALCDIYNHIVTVSEGCVAVNLHFDYSRNAAISVTCQRAERGQLTVRITSPLGERSLALRVPGWTMPESVTVSVDGKCAGFTMDGVFALLPANELPVGSVVEMSYDLPVHDSLETLPTGHEFRFKWRGDEIIGVDPRGEVLPFYPPLQGP